MRTMLYGCLITIALVCHPFVAVGDEHSHRKTAENLLLVLEVDKSLPKIADQVVENQMQHNPQLAAQREVLQRFLTKYVNWESVKEDTITAYTQEFTEPELQKLTEFYNASSLPILEKGEHYPRVIGILALLCSHYKMSL